MIETQKHFYAASIRYILDKPYYNKVGDDKLYIGSIESLKDATKFDAIVSLTRADDAAFVKDMLANTKVNHLHIDVDDEENVSIDAHFNDAHKFIEKNLKKGHSVLVHCVAGRSRSATIVSAHLMNAYKLTAIKAIERVKDARPCIRPNDGFIRQLIDYEKQIIKL